MAESDTPKPVDGVRADSARGAGVPDARPTPVEDGLSATAPPEDDGADDAYPVLTDWPPGQVILDDYAVERELGAGGMGKVYLLRSRSTGQPFAVKRAFLRNEDGRRNFLAELRTWIDLPEHPHLVTCRFFRTVGDEVVIFAEYVEGGSLADWIRERRLTSLEQILDAAIQFAWGLHAAHAFGLVHQDVKPSNALMTADGVVKVADFGLARARAVAVLGEGESRMRPDVTSYRGTPAYKSPEQAAGERLTPATDVWSWGLAVLEMFAGEATWSSGAAAPEALKAYLKRPSDPELPGMPNGVAEVLQKCFRRDPAERWASLTEAADLLQRVYGQAVGKGYHRLTPAVPEPTRWAAATHDRRTRTGGAQWDDPREWLVKAYKADGRDPARADAVMPPLAGSRKAQAIADLAAYEEALDIFDRLVADGRQDLELRLAALCHNKAYLHEHTDDAPGAVALHDRVIAIVERLAGTEAQAKRRQELAQCLAGSYVNKAIALSDMGNKPSAVALFDRAIAIREALVEAEGRRDLADGLANLYMNKGCTVSELGNLPAAVGLFDQALGLYSRLVDSEGRRELAVGLAAVCMNKANAVSKLGDERAAVALYDRAIATYERLVEKEGRRDLADALAHACMTKADTLHDLHDNRAAVALHNRALAIYETLVEKEGRRKLANNLATAYLNKAAAVSGLGDKRAAVALYDRAIAIYERLVEKEGRRDLANDLAQACMNKAANVSELGNKRTAVALFDRAIAIRQRLVEVDGRRELQGDLARVVLWRAYDLLDQGDRQRARSEARKAMPVLKAEITRTGRTDLQRDIDSAIRAIPGILPSRLTRHGDLGAVLYWVAKVLRVVW